MCLLIKQHFLFENKLFLKLNLIKVHQSWWSLRQFTQVLLVRSPYSSYRAGAQGHGPHLSAQLILECSPAGRTQSQLEEITGYITILALFKDPGMLVTNSLLYGAVFIMHLTLPTVIKRLNGFT